ncbi:hypothetical protein DFH08DRAFT_836194 [Mycena albidolilacea]|uniref:G-patch domain-containing protein n=1 Tax=Mycena albidolilacea TaxID=1033008 RepID=A0AAD7F5T5_9AGAR|nr:hypothetical protein DFH08DRAFT_836194 [Mycena albidolilacea]
MPLDVHSHLVSQGWTGSGTGLRQGAISRPLAIPQKKTLAGLGKDRDEAFPFWDHLFSAASKSIQIKLSGDDSDDDSDSAPNAPSLKRTSTGILSNRRPVTGPSADSGATTPDADDDTSPRLSLLASAKREAAKRVLYSRFFRGPVLGPDSPLPISIPATEVSTTTTVVQAVTPAGSVEVVAEKPRKKKRKVVDVEEEERRERKRLKKEKKELKEKKRAEKKSRGKEKEREREVVDAVTTSNSDPETKEKKRKRKREVEDDGVEVGKEDLGNEKESKTLDKESKRKRKEDAEQQDSKQSDKKRRKEEKRKAHEGSQPPSDEAPGPKRKRKRPVE